MSRSGFFNDNQFRAFPFLKDSVGGDGGSQTIVNLSNRVVVDAGFILGPHVEFNPAEHYIRLASIARAGSQLSFEFVSNAPRLYQVPLFFTCNVNTTPYTTIDSDSGEEGLSLSQSLSYSASTTSTNMCDEPLWEGYMVVGDLAPLLAWLPGNGTVTGGSNQGLIEPALISCLFNKQVTAINVFNGERTIHEPPPDCPPLTWDGRPRWRPVTWYWANQLCVRGPIIFEPGYNMEIRQSQFDNAITFAGVVGGGLGEPCGDTAVTLFKKEKPPDGRNTLDGDFACGETLTFINGVHGPFFNFKSTQGARIIPNPGGHSIRIDFDLSGMASRIDENAESI